MEIRTLSRAAQILSSVNAESSGATLSDVVNSVALSKATTHRFLRALVEIDFLSHEPDRGTYRIGPALLRFGASAMQYHDLKAAARPYLEEAQLATGESATLVVPSGEQRLTLDVVLSGQELRAAPEIGGLKPIYEGAAGKAMLAWYRQSELDAVYESLALQHPASRGGAKLRRLKRDMNEIRERGYAISVGESVRGEAASAAPIFGKSGKVVGSLNVSGPELRMPESTLRKNGKMLAAGAASLSKSLKLRWAE